MDVRELVLYILHSHPFTSTHMDFVFIVGLNGGAEFLPNFAKILALVHDKLHNLAIPSQHPNPATLYQCEETQPLALRLQALCTDHRGPTPKRFFLLPPLSEWQSYSGAP